MRPRDGHRPRRDAGPAVCGGKPGANQAQRQQAEPRRHCGEVRWAITIRLASLTQRSFMVRSAGRQCAATTGLDVVSILRTWPARTSPAIGNPGDSTTLVPSGLTGDVTGQPIANRLARQTATGDTTTAGRVPPGSRPLRGSTPVQISSPSSGPNGSIVNDFPADIGPNRTPRAGLRVSCRPADLAADSEATAG